MPLLVTAILIISVIFSFLESASQPDVKATAKEPQEVLGVRDAEGEKAQKKYWLDLLEKHPTYQDGWIQLLYIAESTKDDELREMSTEKLKELDPLMLEKVLEDLKN